MRAEISKEQCSLGSQFENKTVEASSQTPPMSSERSSEVIDLFVEKMDLHGKLLGKLLLQDYARGSTP